MNLNFKANRYAVFCCIAYLSISIITGNKLNIGNGIVKNVSNHPLQNKLKNEDKSIDKSDNCVIEWQLSKFQMNIGQIRTIELMIVPTSDWNWYLDGLTSKLAYDKVFYVKSENENVVNISKTFVSSSKETAMNVTYWLTMNVTIEAYFMGKTRLYIEIHQSNSSQYKIERCQNYAEIVVIRPLNRLDFLYKIILAFFVIILYINFGAAVQLDTLKRIILKPIGPIIGFIGQFLIMPILSYLIGYILFRQQIELRLGLFFTGSTPGGSVSNIFTVLLNGNLNLSITMTALSNLAAFAMMPLWLFTLGSLIFHDGQLAVPYQAIVMVSCSLFIPLSFGIAMQKYCCPQLSKKMIEFLKPISLLLFLAITVFAFTVNSFIFRLFSWEIIIASCTLPWLGYGLGWLMAKILKQSPQDALTIAIETGIQNTGIAIFMLNFTLAQPQADITSAVPVANSMLTPLPLLLIYVVRKLFKQCNCKKNESNNN